jgi:hypothetical protein
MAQKRNSTGANFIQSLMQAYDPSCRAIAGWLNQQRPARYVSLRSSVQVSLHTHVLKATKMYHHKLMSVEICFAFHHARSDRSASAIAYGPKP